MYTVIVQPKAEKQLRKIPRRDQIRIAQAIDALAEHPHAGKKLDGDLSGLYAVRVWPYRIIYTIEKKIITVTIVAIGHRKDVYEKLR